MNFFSGLCTKSVGVGAVVGVILTVGGQWAYRGISGYMANRKAKAEAKPEAK